MIKAIVFDIGQTLIEYNKPLNWKELYRPALEDTAKMCKFNLTEKDYEDATEILLKYNTRINHREYEVSSNTIFEEIFIKWNKDINDIEKAKDAFYSYFSREAYPFEEVKYSLKTLKEKGIMIATLSDVAYGMDNKYALNDIKGIIKYIDLPITSNDIGYRKPNTQGLKYIAEKFKINAESMMYVGDEEKDILCANNGGIYSVLINRTDKEKDFGQRKTIHSLTELFDLI